MPWNFVLVFWGLLIFKPANAFILGQQVDKFFLVARFADGAPGAGNRIGSDLEMILGHAQAAFLEYLSQLLDPIDIA